MPVFSPEDFSLFFEEFGEAAVYTRRGAASGLAVRAVFDEGKFLGMGGDKGEDADEAMRPGMGDYTVVFLDQTAVKNRPMYQDKIRNQAGEVFTILQTKNEDGLWKCWAVGDERASF